MKLKIKSILIFLLMLVSVSVIVNGNSSNNQKLFKATFKNHEPIHIIGNSDLLNQAKNESWIGDGTTNNPISP